jgi:hypothetical protein
VAHKTCDTARQTWKSRRLNHTVHLESARCDGSTHDGCQAECNLFWKDSWLKSTTVVGSNRSHSTQPPKNSQFKCNEADLQAKTRLGGNVSGEALRYCCQATEMYNATEPLAWWSPRQYVFDVTSGNHSLGRVVRVLFLAFLRYLLPRIPAGYTRCKKLHDYMHKRFTGRPAPSLTSKLSCGVPTPTGKLDLKPGEIVQIKAQSEIETTIGVNGRNRGLSFDPDEMAPYCGRNFRVRKSVTKIIDEPTGKMLIMKQPCIMLEGVVCQAEYAHHRLNCPRAIPSYWREIWLARIADNDRPHESKGPPERHTAGDHR